MSVRNVSSVDSFVVKEQAGRIMLMFRLTHAGSSGEPEKLQTQWLSFDAGHASLLSARILELLPQAAKNLPGTAH